MGSNYHIAAENRDLMCELDRWNHKN